MCQRNDCAGIGLFVPLSNTCYLSVFLTVWCHLGMVVGATNSAALAMLGRFGQLGTPGKAISPPGQMWCWREV